MKKIPKLMTSSIVALIFMTPAFGFSENVKVDPRLSLLSQKSANHSTAQKHGILKSVNATAEPLVSTIVRFEGDLAGLEALGGRVRSIFGDIATVDIPLSAVNEVAKFPNVRHIEAAKKMKHRLDVSVQATGANTLRSGTPPSWSGKTGKGVIIGIVDTGIDLNHKDFKNPNGTTRILSLWDQTATTGTPPAGYNYGNECTQAVINGGGCSQKDLDGHGTHVAGIAAGNGSATGNGQSAYRYIGMAPEADLIIVKSPDTSTATLEAIAYIEAKAAALGKPVVINLSRGSHMGPHDGTSNYERGLDNLSGVGKIIVAAAGNEAEDNIHASGAVPQGGSTSVGFAIPAGYGGNLDIWYAGVDLMGISVSNGTCTTPVVTPGNTQTFQTLCGRVDISSSGVNPNNGDREIVVQLSNGTSPLIAGAWNFTLSGNTITNGRFDAWSSDEVAIFTTHADPGITLNDSSTATKTISAAAYITKNTWQSVDGNTYYYEGNYPVGGIASFSSHGPRRACSDTTQCPSLQKPEITAPGMGVMSALSSQFTGLDQAWVEPDGVHALLQGTSMAAPHVAGAVALILQASPMQTSDQIKCILTSYAKRDSYTGPAISYWWGYGKLDVASALTNLLDTIPDSFSLKALTGVPLNALITSNSVTVQGIGLSTSISITGGEYSVNGGAYTSANGTIARGQTVTARLTSAGTYMATTSATLFIGEVSAVFSVTTQAQEFAASTRRFDIGSIISYDLGVAVAVDNGGNVYLTGDFSGTLDFDPGPGVAIQTSTGLHGDSFLTRINADGSYGWTKNLGAKSVNVANKIAVDPLGNVYVTHRDVYLTKINSDGSDGWTKKIGSWSHQDGCFSVATDYAGNIYVVGTFKGSIDFDSGAGIDMHTSISQQNGDIFITRINADGTYGWTKTIRGEGSKAARAVAVGKNGHIFITGHFTGSIDFDPSPVSDFQSAEIKALFLTRINAEGTYGWTKVVGGRSFVNPPQVQSSASIPLPPPLPDGGYIEGHSVSIDKNGDVYVLGTFSLGLIDFDPGAGSDVHKPSTFTAVSLIKINADGTYSWTKIFETGVAGALAALDSEGDIYITGNFLGSFSPSGAVDFDPGTGVDSHSETAPAVFLTRINANGTYGWTKTFNEPNNSNYGSSLASNSIAVDSSGIVYIAGIFSGTIDFDPGPGTELHTSNGEKDIFLAKLVSTAVPDSTPASFNFIAQTGVALGTMATSNSVTVAGINAPSAVSMTGGEYSINGGAWTSTSGTVTNGQTVTARLTSSSNFNTTTSAMLTIGGVSATFSVTTAARDITPDQFTFSPVTGVPINSLVESSAVIISGINDDAPMTITGQGEYSVNGGAWTSAPGTVNNGNSVKVRIMSSGSYLTAVDAKLVINGVQGTFSVTTMEVPDPTPDAFSFPGRVLAPTSLVITSDPVTVSGINVPSPISIVGGEYRIGDGAWTSATGTVTNGQVVRVRQTSSGGFNATTTATLTIGGVSADFAVTTVSSNEHILHATWYSTDAGYNSWISIKNTSGSSIKIVPTLIGYDGSAYVEPVPFTLAPQQATQISLNIYAGKINGQTSAAVELAYSGTAGGIVADVITVGPQGFSFTKPMASAATAISTTLNATWYRADPGANSWVVVKNTSGSTVQANITVSNNGTSYTDPTPITMTPHRAQYINLSQYNAEINAMSGGIELAHTGRPGDVIADVIGLASEGSSYTIEMVDRPTTSNTLRGTWYRADPGYGSWVLVKNNSDDTVYADITVSNNGISYTDRNAAVIPPHEAQYIYLNKYNGNVRAMSAAVELSHSGNSGDVVADLIVMGGEEGYCFIKPMVEGLSATTTLVASWFRVDPGYESWVLVKNNSGSTTQTTISLVTYTGVAYTDPTPVVLQPHQAEYVYLNKYYGHMGGQTAGAITLRSTGIPGDVMADMIAVGQEGYVYTNKLR